MRAESPIPALLIMEDDGAERTLELTDLEIRIGRAPENDLVLAGADPARCARHIYFGHSTAKMRLLGSALSVLQREGPLAWIWVTQEQMERVGAKEEDCEGLVNYALSIGDVEVAVFFRELPEGRFRVSSADNGSH